MTDTREEYELRLRAAEREHDRRTKARELHANQIEAFSLAGMRAPALVAAGGIAAVLGFYSANYERLAADPEKLILFNDILFWLFLSLLASVVAPGLAYFSQIAFARSIIEEEYNYDYPYVHQTRKSRAFAVIGDFFRWVAVGTVLASIGFLMWGGFMFLRIVA